jgi:hypothetical protein
MFFFDESKQINTFMVTEKVFSRPLDMVLFAPPFWGLFLAGYIGDVRIFV